jgi:subtilisin family serine protease
MVRICASTLLAGVLLLLGPGGSKAAPAAARIVVGYSAQGFASADALEGAIGAERIARIEALHADVLRLSPGDPALTLARLRADPRVRYAEFDGLVRALRVPNDEFLSTQWSLAKTRAEQAWDLGTGSPQVIVGVLDTGVDATQPDLRGKLVAGYDYVNNDQDPSDDNGHGTAVAGVVAANTDNGIGVAGYCWGCRVMPVKVLAADGTGFMSGLAQGIVWATDHGARVLNLSLGGPDQDLTLTAAAQYAWTHNVLVVAAAGNESALTPDYPAALPNVLSVGASDQSDRLYSFSNTGARVAAPGENSTTGRGGQYVSFLGTSSAAPVVSGIAALGLSLVPGATPAQVEQALETTAVPIPGVTSGRVDAYAALAALAPGLVQPGTPAPTATAPRQQAGEGASAAAPPRQTKVVRGSLAPGKSATVTVSTGAGILLANVRLRSAGRTVVRLRLLAAGRVTAATRGTGRAKLRARLRARKYRLVVSSDSRKRLAFALTISFPRPSP